MYWKCTVCGYVHKEAEPPETCPVCGADKSRFIAVDAEGNPVDAAPPSDASPSASRWRCTVCGYIHTGSEPPEKCPVCGADRTLFEPVRDEAAVGKADETPPASDAAAAPPPDANRRWKCTVCGYIHTGPEPPEKCPACGADRSLFIELEEEGAAAPPGSPDAAAVAAPKSRRAHYYDMVTDLMVKQHAHPISVHIPNGVAPVAVLFLFLAVLFGCPSLEIAATYNMVVVLLAMPMVVFSGVNDWKKRFGGNMTHVFMTKMICAGVVSALLLILVLWRAMNPAVAATPGGMRTLYLLLHAVLIGAAALAGYMGGKLVFPNR